MIEHASYSELLQIYMSAAEIMQHGVMWLDQDGNILGVNSQFARELGYPKDAFNKKTIFQVNPRTTLLQWHQLWKELETHNQIQLDTEHITAKGTIYPVQMRGILIDVAGDTVCCGIVEDLLESDRFYHLLELTEKTSRTGSWEWDLVKNEILFTTGMFRLLGISERSQLTIEKTKDLMQQYLSEQEYNALAINLKEAVKTGMPFETELNLQLPDEPIRVELRAQPMHSEGFTHKVFGTLHDLTGIARRTDELYLMQFCIDHAHSMIYWVRKDGSFKYVNRAVSQQLGYSEKELRQMTLMDVELDLTKEKWQQQWIQLKEQKNIEIERTRRTKSGEVIPVIITLNYVNFNGKEYCLEFARDLTAKKERDRIIQFASQTLEQARDIIYWIDPDGNFLYFNDTLCTLSGYSRKELERMRLMDLFPNYSEQDFKAGWKQTKSQKARSTELELTCKDGTLLPVEAVLSMSYFEGKEIICAILRDISDRKLKEKELENQLTENERLRNQLEKENTILKEEIELEHSFTHIISKSAAYKPVLQKIEQVADTDTTVLILGETGTGKELLAKAIHQLSNRSERPLIKVNCGALPENLIESELFGHEKGAFTGAYQRKTGRFEAAHRGTLFLDEISELPLDLQVKLLRVLQEKEFERVGSTDTLRVDVRVVAATNRDLIKQVQEGKFRQDLYYRLNVFPIENIPLRERMDDVPLLVRHFVEKYNKQLGKAINEIPQHVLQELMQYDFPGNVRELENIIERGMILSHSEKLRIDFSFKKMPAIETHHFKNMEEMQRAHIIEALRRTQGRVSGENGAAQLLDMNDKTLTSRMKKLGIDRMDYLREPK